MTPSLLKISTAYLDINRKRITMRTIFLQSLEQKNMERGKRGFTFYRVLNKYRHGQMMKKKTGLYLPAMSVGECYCTSQEVHED